MGRKRIAKKKTKEDQFVSATFEVGHYIQENLTRLVLGTVGVLALIGIVWLVVKYHYDRAEEAAVVMFKAEAQYLNSQYALAATDFEKVSKDYSGSATARKALFFAGDSYYNAGEYEKALTKFEECLEKLSGSDPLVVNCLVGLAASSEELKNWDKAIEYYKKAGEKAEYDFQKLEIMRNLSRVLAMAGKNEEALVLMDKIIADYPDNPLTGTIIELRAELLARATQIPKAG